MSMKDFIIYAILAGVSIWILRLYHVIGAGKGKRAVSSDKKNIDKAIKKRDRTIKFLKQMSQLSEMTGGKMSQYEENEMRYHIERTNCYIGQIERYIKPAEVDGICKLIGLAAAGLGFTLVITMLGKSIVLVVIGIVIACLGVFGKKVFMTFTGASIASDDEELERDFPDLYLLLHSRLKKGTKARLAPTLEEYSKSLVSMYGPMADDMAIKKFTDDLRNYISIYADDTIAIRRIREKYRGSTITNFVNLAVQSLSGVDNLEKLAAFEQELLMQQKEMMKAKADKAIAKGMRATKLVYLILLEFVILSFASKIDLSMFSMLF